MWIRRRMVLSLKNMTAEFMPYCNLKKQLAVICLIVFIFF